MAYDFSVFKGEISGVDSRLKKELASIQTGRANAAILDEVRVDAYGSKVSIEHVASVTTEGPRMLRVAPWDGTLCKHIERVIEDAGLGVTVGADDRGIRVVFPELTGERRTELLKYAGKKHEEARVALRAARDNVWHDIQEKEREGDIGEDEKFRLKESMEKLVKDANESLDALLEKKTSELSG